MSPASVGGLSVLAKSFPSAAAVAPGDDREKPEIDTRHPEPEQEDSDGEEHAEFGVWAKERSVVDGFDQVRAAPGDLEHACGLSVDLNLEPAVGYNFDDAFARADIESFDVGPGLDVGAVCRAGSFNDGVHGNRGDGTDPTLLGRLNPGELFFELQQDPRGNHGHKREHAEDRCPSVGPSAPDMEPASDGMASVMGRGFHFLRSMSRRQRDWWFGDR